MIVQDGEDFPSVIAIYGAVGYHDPMVGGHADPTGYETKGDLREVDVHVSVDFFLHRV